MQLTQLISPNLSLNFGLQPQHPHLRLEFRSRRAAEMWAQSYCLHLLSRNCRRSPPSKCWYHQFPLSPSSERWFFVDREYSIITDLQQPTPWPHSPNIRRFAATGMSGPFSQQVIGRYTTRTCSPHVSFRPKFILQWFAGNNTSRTPIRHFRSVFIPRQPKSLGEAEEGKQFFSINLKTFLYSFQILKKFPLNLY